MPCGRSILDGPLRLVWMVMAVVCLCVPTAQSSSLTERGDDLLDRPISSVEVRGLQRVNEQDVRNNIRAMVGDPYDPQVVILDVQRLTRLAQFRYVDALAELLDDGTVRVTYQLQEQQLITVVQVVGNRLLSDQDLLKVVRLIEGGPRDDYLIEKAKKAIEEEYQDAGYYQASVTIDETQLDESGILIFRVVEGPRVRIRAIAFDGNAAFTDKKLKAQVKTKQAVFLFAKGEIDTDQLAEDVAIIDRFYKDRGYLDIRVDRRIELSPDNREAKVTFLIAEGRQYTLRRVVTTNADKPGEPLTVYSADQLAAMLEIRTGDVYSQEKIRKSIEVIREAYGILGYADIAVTVFEIRRSDAPEVDLELVVREGERYRVGLINIKGNTLTKDKVIRRLVRQKPGRPLDITELEKAELRIKRSRLFGRDVRITVLSPDEALGEYRDLLVEVKETNTGAINFGVAAGTDSGLFGEFSIRQRNFAIDDWPESFDELLKGRAFRGGGQNFSMVLRPGAELFQYLVSLTEPHFLESDYSLSVSGAFRERQFNTHDEQRISASLGSGRKLGDVWDFSVSTRFERVEYRNIDDDAPTEFFLDAGPDQLTGLSFSLIRSTITTLRRPGKGSRLELSFEQVGLFGGDIEFSRVEGEYTLLLTLDEDFLGRKSILRLQTRAGYIFNEDDRVPTYERFYLGGRSLRGFDFREVSPKGIRNDNGQPSNDPVGGTWMFFAGAQYEIPVFQETVNAVVFVDSGTVTDDVGFEQYRVSVGAGVRLYIPQFGPVPIALDFAWPLRKEDADDTQLFSFTAELPF
jgi:outer membrane protein insertion porin family